MFSKTKCKLLGSNLSELNKTVNISADYTLAVIFCVSRCL